MPRHGFVRPARFEIVAAAPAEARLRLVDSAATREHYPFAFALDIVAKLAEMDLALAFEVENRDRRPLPYQVGWHPAFPWPFDGGAREEYRIVFERAEAPLVPRITEAGLLTRPERPIPLDGNRLPLSPALFARNALVFLDAASRRLAFEAPSGAAIEMEVEDFQHFALWTKPTAPFLSIEAWTGHADLDGFAGDLAERASIRLLAPGARARHTVRLRWRPA
ncbi:MAG TPA: aldose 1-epimerase family protein [Beijerinckiaceae bacterium]|nr:aldose 1-epimerase family protein [Beijerinckiaceae bacterium]